MSLRLQKVWIRGRWIRFGHVVAYGEPGGYEIGRVVEIITDDTGDEVILTLSSVIGPRWGVFADHVVIVKGLR